MAAGVRVGHPSEPLGRKFVPRVAWEDETRRSRARLGPKMVHTWGPRGGHFQTKSGKWVAQNASQNSFVKKK